MKHDRIVIQGILIQGFCGITREERQKAQPLLIDLEFHGKLPVAPVDNHISHTIDYAQVIHYIVQFGSSRSFALIESLAEELCHFLFTQFPIDRMALWVRKTSPPLEQHVDSVGVRLNRTRDIGSCHQFDDLKPASFLVEQLPRLSKGRVLDVATGQGRNALFLASLGFQVVGIDRDQQALTAMRAQAKDKHLNTVHVTHMDLEIQDPTPPNLGTEEYDVILVFFYLYRPLFPSLFQALKPGGLLLYETFLIDNHWHYHHPRRKEFCLDHNELLQLTTGLRTLHYDEAERISHSGHQSTFTAQLLAQKPSFATHTELNGTD